MKNRLMLRAVAPALFLTIAWSGRAQNCSNHDFSGVYSATVLGTFIVPPPGVPIGPTARVARVTPDGNGNTTIEATLSLDGIILQETYGGVYTINPDCTSAVTLNVPIPGGTGTVPFHFSGVLSNDRRNMDIILLDPQGTDIHIALRKQRQASCTNKDLKGDYAMVMTGTVVNQFNIMPGLFARNGKITFDGDGGFKANVQTSYAGKVVPESMSGTYAVNADCTFNMSYSMFSVWTYFGVMADTISGANMIQSAPGGAVITGTLVSIQ